MEKIGMFWGSNTGNQEEASGFLKDFMESEGIEMDEYNIADMAIHPWYGYLVLNNAYNAAEFLDVKSYKNVIRSAEEISERLAFKRGARVGRPPSGPEDKAIPERHDASDLD